MAERKDTTIVLQAGLNAINGSGNQVEFYGFVPIYDDLLDPHVMVNPIDPEESVSDHAIQSGVLNLDDFTGAYYFNVGGKYELADRGYAYCSSANGYADIQGYAPAIMVNNQLMALAHGNGTNAVKDAAINGDSVEGTNWNSVSVSGWTNENVWRNIMAVREVTNDDNVKFKQYTVTINANETGDIVFNKLLVFVNGSAGIAPIAVIALANPVTVYENSIEEGSFSTFSVMFSIGFTANLEQIPVHIAGETSGYWGYAEKNDSVDAVMPIAYPGRLYVGNMADHSASDVSAFVTMSGKQTSGLQYVDYFSDEDATTYSYREIGGSIVNVSGALPSSGGINESIVMGVSTSSFGSINDSVACVWKPTYTSRYNLILTNPTTGTLTSAHSVDGNHETSSWGGWGFDADEISAFQGKINHSIVNGLASGTSARYFIGVSNSVVVSNPHTNIQGFQGTLAINSVLVSPSRPQCENSVFVGTINTSGTQERNPFLSNSLVVGSNNMVVRTSITIDSENKRGHYIRSQKPVVILGHDNCISAYNNTIGDDTYSAYVFGSNVSAYFSSADCDSPKYIFGDGFVASNYDHITGSSYTREIWPMFEIGSSDNNVGFVVGKTNVVAPGVNSTNTLIQIKNMVDYRSGLPSGSLYVKTENNTNYVCIV